MTIQLPILIWTVISFCVLMLVLNRLLFQPLLKFMDARQEKIDRAHAAREEAARAKNAAQAAAEQARLAAHKRAQADAQSALEAEKRAAAQRLAQKEQEYAALREQSASEMDAEKRAIRQKLDAGMEDLVSAFVGKLVQ